MNILHTFTHDNLTSLHHTLCVFHTSHIIHHASDSFPNEQLQVSGAGGGGKGPARVSNHLRKDKAGKFIGYTYKKPKPKSRPTLGLTFPGDADGAAGGGGGGGEP